MGNLEVGGVAGAMRGCALVPVFNLDSHFRLKYRATNNFCHHVRQDEVGELKKNDSQKMKRNKPLSHKDKASNSTTSKNSSLPFFLLSQALPTPCHPRRLLDHSLKNQTGTHAFFDRIYHKTQPSPLANGQSCC